MLRLRFAMAAGRLAGRLSRLAGRGGSALPGLIAERIEPATIERLVAGLPVVVVTGTNGKTTTTKMLVRALEASGRRVLTNRTGSNLARGIATCLIDAARGTTVAADLAVFEIDEAAVRTLAPRLRPRLIVATNLARDQLDRFGELATTAGHVAEAARHAEIVVLNADDPLVSQFGEDREEVRWFGATPGIRRLMPDDRNLYGGGAPDVVERNLDVRVAASEPSGDGQVVALEVGGRVETLSLQVPGVYNAYNAAGALAAALALDVALDEAVAAFSGMEPAFGRGQVIEFRQRRVKVLLVKNPAGFNQAIRLLGAAEPMPVLIAINDLDADGRDVSWLWDARVEDLAAAEHRYRTGGIRAHDMALRLKYAGVEAPATPDLAGAVEALLADTESGDEVAIVPTYTAMLELLDLLLPDATRREVWT